MIISGTLGIGLASDLLEKSANVAGVGASVKSKSFIAWEMPTADFENQKLGKRITFGNSLRDFAERRQLQQMGARGY